jgi:hypothetical protein
MSVECLADGPFCHDDPECRNKRLRWKESVEKKGSGIPIIFVGAGTCGLGAGAGAHHRGDP